MTSHTGEDPFVGFKVLRIFGQKTPTLISQNDFGDIWLPGWNQGLCADTPETIPHPEGEIPATACKCGFHVWASLELAQFHAENHIALQGHVLFAVIIGAGNLEIHPGEGWRSQYAKIVGLVADPPPLPLGQILQGHLARWLARLIYGSKWATQPPRFVPFPSNPWSISDRNWLNRGLCRLGLATRQHPNTAENPSPRLLRLAQIYSARLVSPAQATLIASEYGELQAAIPIQDYQERGVLSEQDLPFEDTPYSRGDILTTVGASIMFLAYALLTFGPGKPFLVPLFAFGASGGLITLVGATVLGFETLRHRKDRRLAQEREADAFLSDLTLIEHLNEGLVTKPELG